MRLPFALLLYASLAHAMPIFLSGFDGVDDSTTTAIDTKFEWTEQLVGAGTVDADAQAQTTIAHVALSGGATGSKYALRAESTASGRSAYYIMANPLRPSDPSVYLGASIHLTSTNFSGPRTVMAMLEGTADPGCAIVVNADRTLSLIYAGGGSDGTCAGGTEGTQSTCDSDELCYAGVCRKWWGTTSNSTDAIRRLACDTNPTVPCTADGDCPLNNAGAQGSCSVDYWAGVELGQTTQTNAVICEMYLNGVAFFTGTSKAIGGSNLVGSVVNAAVGITDYGTTTSTAVVYVDDFVMDDGGHRAYYGYVDELVPTGIGDTTGGTGGNNDDWTTSNCRGSTHWECVNDYNNASAYTYDANTGTTSDGTLQSSQAGKLTDLQLSGITLGTGQIVSAVEAVAIGRGAGTGTGRKFSQALLASNGTQWIASASRIVTGASTCTCWDATDCSSTGICVVPDTATHQPLQRFLTITSPLAGAGNWDPNNIRQRIQNQNTTKTRSVFVGATMVYVRVQKPDTFERVGSLRQHNKGAETGGVDGANGLVTIAAIGDSTLGGTLEVSCNGGTNDGALCGQPDYCGYDAVAAGGNQDQPPGGCSQFGCPADGVTACDACRRCTANHAIACPGADNQNCVDAGLSPNTCDGSGAVAACTSSCPGGGFCPTDRVGWAQNLSTATGADVILTCPLGGEDTGQMLQNRFADIVDGRANATSQCVALQGSGACTCSSATDCASSGGTCTSGLCTAGDPKKTACKQYTDCNTAGGFYCQLPRPDYLVVLEGYNDILQYPFLETGTSMRYLHDPECELSESYLASQGGSAIYPSGTPVKHCPQYGSSGYARPETQCGSQADCSSISATSDCFGVCTSGASVTHCVINPDCPNADCSVNLTFCDTNTQCAGLTCTANHTATFQAYLPGLCQCTSDANCAAAYHCVGLNGGKKVCRRKSAAGASDCTVNADCGSFANCDTTTCDTSGNCDNTAYNFCKGRCTVPCNAVSCTRDGDCGGTDVTARWGGLRKRHIQGTCNLATGKCACCGTVRCGEQDVLMRSGCSCTTATQTTDCGTSGVCTNGVCTANDGSLPLRLNCRQDTECAPGRQCMRCAEQARQYEVPFTGLYAEVVNRMQNYINALNDSTPPVLLASEIPLNNGAVSAAPTAFVRDAACTGAWPIRSYYARSLNELLAVLPARHVIGQSTFNDGRIRSAYHTDQTHFSSTGSVVVGSAVANALNLLNVCLKSDGTAQKYCRSKAGVYATTPSNGTCTLDADCAAGQTCSRRPCNGDIANCPGGGGISCGAD